MKTLKTRHSILPPAILLATLAFSAAGETHRDGTVNANAPGNRSGAVQYHAGESLGTLAKFSDITGLDVTNPQGEKLGKVRDAVLDVASGRVVVYIISSGGLLGFAERHVSVPVSAFHYDEAKQALHLDATKESLQNAPAFDDAQWQEFRRQPASVASVYQYHGARPFFTNGVSNVDTTAPGRRDRETRSVTVSEDGVTTPNADNTGVNRRDRDGRTQTPVNQGNSQADISTTARIRKDVLGQSGMSVAAQNVKIVTSNGRVTLRGPVETEEERRVIGSIAAVVNGSGAVDNQLEVKQP